MPPPRPPASVNDHQVEWRHCGPTLSVEGVCGADESRHMITLCQYGSSDGVRFVLGYSTHALRIGLLGV